MRFTIIKSNFCHLRSKFDLVKNCSIRKPLWFTRKRKVMLLILDKKVFQEIYFPERSHVFSTM